MKLTHLLHELLAVLDEERLAVGQPACDVIISRALRMLQHDVKLARELIDERGSATEAGHLLHAGGADR